MLTKSPEQGVVGKMLLGWKFKRACWKGLVPREASMPENMLQSLSLGCSGQLMPGTGACRGGACAGKSQINITDHNDMWRKAMLCMIMPCIVTTIGKECMRLAGSQAK